MVPEPFTDFIAIDWSGQAVEHPKGLAVARCRAGTAAPELIDRAWSRADILAWLKALAAEGARALIGLDLGMSLPFADHGAFFPGWAESPADARGLWALVDRICATDPHLAASSFVDHADAARHFRRHGGRTGDLFEPGRGRLRETERHQLLQGVSPVSNLNLVGAAQVGKSSLTGMRVLHRLGGAIPVWPFDPPPSSGPMIVEIYTSIAAVAAGRRRGRTKMTSIEALNQALTAPAIASAPVAGDGPIDDHRSDALLTAAWLRNHAARPELWHPGALTPEIAGTEGWTFGVP